MVTPRSPFSSLLPVSARGVLGRLRLRWDAFPNLKFDEQDIHTMRREMRMKIVELGKKQAQRRLVRAAAESRSHALESQEHDVSCHTHEDTGGSMKAAGMDGHGLRNGMRCSVA